MYSYKTYNKISSIGKKKWDLCAKKSNPFLSYTFLNNIEESKSIGPGTSWLANYLCIFDKKEIIAVAPMYIKLDSQGEYVFDHTWANAYYNAGGKYYPKLQISVPFTPVTGNRILIKDSIALEKQNEVTNYFAKIIINITDNNFSSAHITFCTKQESIALNKNTFLTRIGEQFHWKNDNYLNFNDFLNSLTSRKRKSISKERKYIKEKNIEIILKSGKEIEDVDWDYMYDFYINTSEKKWGNAYLNKDFFKLLKKNFSNKILIIFAKESGETIAAAMHIMGNKSLYGRYWGSIKNIKYLHFELCYYQAIEWAIVNKYKFVEGGAQGPHKIQRGYLAAKTYSSHYIANINFRNAIKDFLNKEKEIINNDIQTINQEFTPFKKN
ncbi:MAG: hypothetical protein CMJ12_02470 [Pelagibacterales bacterium]|nr:hypothetical protein [Pelagibacterales bacterium]